MNSVLLAVVLMLMLATILSLLLLSLLPFWSIIACATSEQNSPKQKGLWIIFMLLTWSLGGLLYGIRSSSPTGLRRTSRGLLFIMLGMFVLYMGLTALSPEVASKVRDRIKESRGASVERSVEGVGLE